jgi:hypothetical protein
VTLPRLRSSLWPLLLIVAIFPLFYFAGFHLGYFNGFTAIPVTLLGLAWHRHRVAATAGATLPVAA